MAICRHSCRPDPGGVETRPPQMGPQLSPRLPPGQDAPPELPQEHLEVLISVLGVVFEAGALEVLDLERVAVLQLLLDPLGERVAELGDATIRLPVGQEAAADV